MRHNRDIVHAFVHSINTLVVDKLIMTLTFIIDNSLFGLSDGGLISPEEA
jgi:hypothetical protein